jgi:acyl dehydratase
MTRDLPDAPSAVQLYARTIFALLRRPGTRSALPEPFAIPASRFRPIPERLASYIRHCGFTGQQMPLPFLYVIGTKAQMALLADKRCPYPAIGLVQTGVEISRGPAFDRLLETPALVQASITDRGEVAGGRDLEIVLDITTEAHGLAGKVVAKYRLRQGRAKSDRPGALPPAPLTGGRSNDEAFSANRGRVYARISGDYNPIHLNKLLARMFGFKQPILHGMDTVATALARSGIANPEHLECRFKRPVYLPARVKMAFGHRGATTDFQVVGADDVNMHVEGSFR